MATRLTKARLLENLRGERAKLEAMLTQLSDEQHAHCRSHSKHIRKFLDQLAVSK